MYLTLIDAYIYSKKKKKKCLHLEKSEVKCMIKKKQPT